MKGPATASLGVALAFLGACVPFSEPTVSYPLTEDAMVEIPASYAVYDGDLEAFIDAAASQDLNDAEREYLSALREWGLHASTPFLMAFRAGSRGDSGTEIVFITEGGPPIDWSSFPEDEWLKSGVPPGVEQASVEFTSVSGADAVFLRYFDPSAGVGDRLPVGWWATILRFNSGDRTYTISATTPSAPSQALDSVLIEIAESVRPMENDR